MHFKSTDKKMAIPKERLLKLYGLSAKIFEQNFNPTGVRTGSHILSKRLKGPAVAGYYGNPDWIKFKNLSTLFPDVDFVDPVEQYRLNKVSDLKRRGKGAPKKTKKNDATPKKGKGKN